MMRKWLIVLVLLMGSLQMFAGEEKNDSGGESGTGLQGGY